MHREVVLVCHRRTRAPRMQSLRSRANFVEGKRMAVASVARKGIVAGLAGKQSRLVGGDPGDKEGIPETPTGLG